MQSSGIKRGRSLTIGAAILVALGSVLLTAGTAQAAPRVTHFPEIKFFSTTGQVTLTIPTASCSSCEWMLSVDEPQTAGPTVVGTAVGTSGVLTVAYPADFCGVIQADALLGPAPWDLRVGHRRTIQTASPCPPITPTTTTTTTTSTTQPPTTTTKAPTTSTTRPPTTSTTTPGVTKATSQLPFSNSSASSTTTTIASVPVEAAAVSGTTNSPAGATLPFTGLDVKPLALLGTALILLGLLILTTLEQRRRALRRVSAAVRTGPERASRASRWFLGE